MVLDILEEYDLYGLVFTVVEDPTSKNGISSSRRTNISSIGVVKKEDDLLQIT